jgi:hypothetical protein
VTANGEKVTDMNKRYTSAELSGEGVVLRPRQEELSAGGSETG